MKRIVLNAVTDLTWSTLEDKEEFPKSFINPLQVLDDIISEKDSKPHWGEAWEDILHCRNPYLATIRGSKGGGGLPL